MSTNIADAIKIMEAFMHRTGVLNSKISPKRYLWTDAFAVQNLLQVHRLTADLKYQTWAMTLIIQVHHVLGKHRADDPLGRHGWISGLAEADGESRPTAGGLRIGKPLPERHPNDRSPADEDEDYDRDGQYFHYLTKWTGALLTAAQHTGKHDFLKTAYELVRAIHPKFVYESRGGGTRMHWKKSVDLSRPLTRSQGQHDPLDGYLTYWAVDVLANQEPFLQDCSVTMLQQERSQLHSILHCSPTTDSLGLGGLLMDMGRTWRILHFLASTSQSSFTSTDLSHVTELLQQLILAVTQSLRSFMAYKEQEFSSKPRRRLPFREFGLALGLLSLSGLREEVHTHIQEVIKDATLQQKIVASLDMMTQFQPMAEEIISFWMRQEHQQVPTWMEHEDINAVMLATCLLGPDTIKW